MTVDTQITADDLLRMPDDGWKYELVQGELRKMSPSGSRHSIIAARIITSLGQHVEEHGLGAVFAAEGGFRLFRDPDTVRAPDAAFVRTERVVDTPKYFEGAPDVAFEVVSPGDLYSEIERKTLDFLRAGTRAVVVVDPQTERVHVHRADGSSNVLDALQIEDVLPGWKLPLAKLFK